MEKHYLLKVIKKNGGELDNMIDTYCNIYFNTKNEEVCMAMNDLLRSISGVKKVFVACKFKGENAIAIFDMDKDGKMHEVSVDENGKCYIV